ncbi:MAG: hypothetical protein RBS56_00095 [Candidatus Gracilibacteria bacterium]|jgi:hypothetical protein|nr:hypothetical protein [Candidatus Gracilibacteria bacterium]
MDQKSNTNLSPVAKTVLDALSPFYEEILRIPDPQTGKSFTEILNRMAKYGNELSKDLTPEERQFFEGQVAPLIEYVTQKLTEIREKVKNDTAGKPERQTEYNVKANFVTGLKKEAYKIEEKIQEEE